MFKYFEATLDFIRSKYYTYWYCINADYTLAKVAVLVMIGDEFKFLLLAYSDIDSEYDEDLKLLSRTIITRSQLETYIYLYAGDEDYYSEFVAGHECIIGPSSKMVGYDQLFPGNPLGINQYGVAKIPM